MIKNENQLTSVRKRVDEFRKQLRRIRKKFEGAELDLLSEPILDEIENIENEIQEYEQLKELSLEEAVSLLLRKPVLLDDISDLLARLRIAAGLTQAELADKLGWQQSNLSRFENPNYSSQTISKVVEYASTLQVWLHVCPSMSEIPATESDTEIYTEWSKVVLHEGVAKPEDLIGISSSDSTKVFQPEPAFFELPQNTQILPYEEEFEPEYELT